MVSRSLFLFPVYKRHFVFFPGNHYLFVSSTPHILWIGRPRKYRYSRWNFTNILFLTKFLLLPVLGATLDFRISVHDNTSAYQDYNYDQNTYDTKTYLFLIAHLWGTFSDHTSPSIFVMYSSAILHFRWRVTSRNHAYSIIRSGAHENMKVIIENICCF